MADEWIGAVEEDLRVTAEERRFEVQALRATSQRIAAAAGWGLQEVTRVAGVSFDTPDGRLLLMPAGAVFKALALLADEPGARERVERLAREAEGP